MTDRADNRVRELVDRIGRQRIRDNLRITNQAISMWIAEGSIPAARYLQLDRLGKEAGVYVPTGLFREAA